MIARLLQEAEGVVAPSLSACVMVGGEVRLLWNPGRVYDLASLTKVLCTTEVALRLADEGRLPLDAGHPLWPPGVTARHLLQHSAGYLWWKELWKLPGVPARADIVAHALREPLVSPPGDRHAYSDLGFLALGAAIEAVGGARIDQLWSAPGLTWGHPAAEPTGEGPDGVVNDENARALGGVAAHAGLFGTAEAVARQVSRWIAGEVPLSSEIHARGAGSHALGWDTPSGELSSAGPCPPADALGHTGFTGTSAWFSRSLGVVAVLLSNRVAYGRDPARIRALRHAWHGEAWLLATSSRPPG
ncbi:MAG: beta-lactamase family protein [Deltaproteobacteria bacterium]|nr:beta-lactamase family protein [Deltaproteobacteria bacterium]